MGVQSSESAAALGSGHWCSRILEQLTAATVYKRRSFMIYVTPQVDKRRSSEGCQGGSVGEQASHRAVMPVAQVPIRPVALCLPRYLPHHFLVSVPKKCL